LGSKEKNEDLDIAIVASAKKLTNISDVRKLSIQNKCDILAALQESIAKLGENSG
jgi:hypothetical protein